MAGNLRQIFKSLIEQISKSALCITSNAIERTQNKTSITQYNFFDKFSNVVKQLNTSTFAEDVKTASLQISRPLPKHIVNYWQWYQELTGLDKVDIAKQKVTIVQDKLFECQNQRRNLTQQISFINVKLKEIYSELIQTKRDDPKYVQLTILENRSLQEHSRISEQLEILEDEERDNFTQLATSIKEYHDCQIMNNQKFKYLSIIASTILAILSLIGSMLYNHKIISEIKYAIISGENSMENNLNKEFFKLTNIIQQQNSAINTLNLKINERSNIEEIENTPNLQTNKLLNSNMIEKTSYCVGFGCLTLYILSKIFRS